MSIIVASNSQVLDSLVKNREALIKAGIQIDDFITHYKQQVAIEKEQAPKEKKQRKYVPRGKGKKTIARLSNDEKRNELFRTNAAGIQITRTNIDFSEQESYEGFEKILKDAEKAEDSRTVFYIGARIVMADDSMDADEVENMRMLYRMNRNKIEIQEFRPNDLGHMLDSYGKVVIYTEIVYVEKRYVPLEYSGSCDSKSHIVTHSFKGNDEEYLTMRTESIKSKDHNCLIVAMSSVSEDKTRAHKLRAELNIPEGPIEVDYADIIAERLKVTYAIYRIDGNVIECIQESLTVSSRHVNILLHDDHYWKILSDVLPLRDLCAEQSMQVQATLDIAPQICDNIVTLRGEPCDEQGLERVKFINELVDPTVEQVIQLVEEKKNLLIIGAGGCGKTYLLKKLPGVIMTATTSCAAELLNGTTIHMHMAKNRKAKGQRVVCDEVSMMGSILFEELWSWAHKKNQLILSGDFLQLPPVNDRFAFQSSSFYEFAASAVLVKLTIVKRQENVDQALFLNNLREGIVDKEYLHSLSRNVVRRPELVLASKRDFVAEYNASKLRELGSPIVDYETTITKGDKIRTHSNQLAAECNAIMTKNIQPFFNGQRVTVVATYEHTVKVRTEQGTEHEVSYTEDVDGNRREKYMPVEACYALTIHKSQGQTVNSCVVHVDGLFEQGMAYVALSRCTDLSRVQIKDRIDLSDKGWQPNSVALEFYKSGRTCPADQLLFISNTKKQLKNIIVKQWEPLHKKLNAIYIDFETYLVNGVQKPYYNKVLHVKGKDIVHEQSYFDQLWSDGTRCNVGQQSWDYIRDVAVAYGDNMLRLKQDPKLLGIVRKERKLTPTIIGYNLSGFDLHFLVQQYLQDDLCSSRFKLSTIYKGTCLIFFQVFDRLSQELVLKTHDMFQFFNCSLADALKNFCGAQAKQFAAKIEFKDEIMHICHNYHSNHDILRPGVETEIQRMVYDQTSSKPVFTGKKVKLFEEVIRYADNDVDVLPILYQCVDEQCRETFNANCTDFLTSGSMTWYASITHLPQEAYEKIKWDDNGNKVSKRLNTKLYRLEKNEEEFIRDSIKGGRVAPRIHQVKNDKLVYLDISGMYAGIMAQENLPYGRAIWLDEKTVKVLFNTVTQYSRADNWRSIYEALTKSFGLFICECDFQENQSNLEPIVQFKDDKGNTRWTVERRRDVITSIDLSLIIASGGKIFSIDRVLRWENNGPILSTWISKTLAIKKEGEQQGNAAKKSFGKLLANAAYGQTLKRDRQEVTTFISSWKQADSFVRDNRLQEMFECGSFTIMKGEKIQQADSFVTSRCSFLGSFVLGYTRAMIHEIVEIACPNRYNEQGVSEQPIYGDTDSLVFRQWQAERLIQAGWVQKKNGKLTDELTDDKAHWFLPKRLQASLPNGSIAQQQEYIWNNATEQEKRNPVNFRFSHATDFIAAGPKSYACKYVDANGNNPNEKWKFKGVPKTALVDGQKLSFDRIGIAYENPGESVAVLQNGLRVIKRFSKAEGSEMFSQVVDAASRNGKPISRVLFKTVWQGRQHLDQDYQNLTVPWGWLAVRQ